MITAVPQQQEDQYKAKSAYSSARSTDTGFNAMLREIKPKGWYSNHSPKQPRCRCKPVPVLRELI